MSTVRSVEAARCASCDAALAGSYCHNCGEPRPHPGLGLTRREILRVAAATLAPALSGARPRAALGQTPNSIGAYAPGVLSSGIRSRFVDNGNAMTTHV